LRRGNSRAASIREIRHITAVYEIFDISPQAFTGIDRPAASGWD
jgi:hypothetical protein